MPNVSRLKLNVQLKTQRLVPNGPRLVVIPGAGNLDTRFGLTSSSDGTSGRLPVGLNAEQDDQKRDRKDRKPVNKNKVSAEQPECKQQPDLNTLDLAVDDAWLCVDKKGKGKTKVLKVGGISKERISSFSSSSHTVASSGEGGIRHNGSQVNDTERGAATGDADSDADMVGDEPSVEDGGSCSSAEESEEEDDSERTGGDPSQQPSGATGGSLNAQPKTGDDICNSESSCDDDDDDDGWETVAFRKKNAASSRQQNIQNIGRASSSAATKRRAPVVTMAKGSRRGVRQQELDVRPVTTSNRGTTSRGRNENVARPPSGSSTWYNEQTKPPRFQKKRAPAPKVVLPLIDQSNRPTDERVSKPKVSVRDEEGLLRALDELNFDDDDEDDAVSEAGGSSSNVTASAGSANNNNNNKKMMIMHNIQHNGNSSVAGTGQAHLPNGIGTGTITRAAGASNSGVAGHAPVDVNCGTVHQREGVPRAPASSFSSNALDAHLAFTPITNIYQYRPSYFQLLDIMAAIEKVGPS